MRVVIIRHLTPIFPVDSDLLFNPASILGNGSPVRTRSYDDMILSTSDV